MPRELLAQNDAREVYVLDTNVLLHDPSSIFRFKEHIVILPISTIEELDAKKSDPLIGYNARDISVKLESLLSRDYDPDRGAVIPNGHDGRLLILSGHLASGFPKELSLSYKDNVLLAHVMGLRERYPERRIHFVTKDRNLRIKMRAHGVATEDYLHDKVAPESLARFFRPLPRLVLTDRDVDELFGQSGAERPGLPYRRSWRLGYNGGAVLVDSAGHAFGLGYRKGDVLRFVEYDSVRVFGGGPKVLDRERFSRNYEQALCMLQALDQDVAVQIIIGRAGTGKTYIAMAAALQMVLEEGRYGAIKLVKPIVTRSRLGEDIGYLPGSVRRKLLPRMRPFIEKLRHFTGTPEGKSSYLGLLDRNIIELVNLADVRGADLANSVVIFDEAQNANPFQMRTLGTRLGEHTKLIVLGDPTQIDTVYLDEYSNALINLYLNAQRHPTPFLAQVCLTQMVRSHTSRWFEETIQPQQTRARRR